ncbi:LysR family transcriptional regulator [Paraburkholderia sp. GAS448]|uniref:LysR family transcriptional regulator n=1 Tax=Paraburkholderia sp. GAS448 TaxID=3035136 RepID=UPI003D218978
MGQITHLNDLRLFTEIVEHGNYMVAGRGLGIQTSKLSRRIRARPATRETSRFTAPRSS